MRDDYNVVLNLFQRRILIKHYSILTSLDKMALKGASDAFRKIEHGAIAKRFWHDSESSK